MKKILFAVVAAGALLCGSAFAATPTVQQIESAMSQGDWQRADSGLSQVLEAHPDSAHAHYLYAQVLDREGRYSDALSHLRQAHTLDPQTKFTTPSRFAQVEAKIRSDAGHASSNQNAFAPPAPQPAHGMMSSIGAAAPAAAVAGHGPSMGMWIGIAIVIVLIALVLRWTVRRAKSNEDAHANDDRRDQLKRTTDLLNAVRSLKLDLRLSTAAGHDVLEKEAEGLEAQLRQLAEALSGSTNPVPPYQVEDLERQFDSLKARAEGRPDPHAAAPNAYTAGGDSAYAREADANFGRGQPTPYPPYQPPPPQPVIVQQGGGFGGGMGGLLTGVLLGEAMNAGRDRVVERDVIVDDERHRSDDNNNGGVDYGQGDNNWDDGSGNVDLGSNDDSGGWDDNNV